MKEDNTCVRCGKRETRPNDMFCSVCTNYLYVLKVCKQYRKEKRRLPQKIVFELNNLCHLRKLKEEYLPKKDWN